MSGVFMDAVTAKYRLTCDKPGCENTWSSGVVPATCESNCRQVRVAFTQGWRMFVGARSQHTYCPDHGPKAPMRLLYGPRTAAT